MNKRKGVNTVSAPNLLCPLVTWILMLIGQGISAIVNKMTNFKHSNFLFDRQLIRVLSLQKNRAKYDPIKCVI